MSKSIYLGASKLDDANEHFLRSSSPVISINKPLCAFVNLFDLSEQWCVYRGGHWGVLETAKPKRKSSKTAKPQKNSAKTENRIQNRQKTDTMVTSGAYRANYTNTLFNQSIFGCHRLL